MITAMIPKLPMRNKEKTRAFYAELGFENSDNDFQGYLMLKKNGLEIRFLNLQVLIRQKIMDRSISGVQI